MKQKKYKDQRERASYLNQILKSYKFLFKTLANDVFLMSILHGVKWKNGWCPKRCGVKKILFFLVFNSLVDIKSKGNEQELDSLRNTYYATYHSTSGR